MPKRAAAAPSEPPPSDPGPAWATWLQAQLDQRGWRPVDLVRAAGTRPDGQPNVRSERLTNWLRQGQRPSYDLAIIVAAALGAPANDALQVAGYGTVPPAVEAALRHLAEQPRPVDLAGTPTAVLVDELHRRFVRDSQPDALRIVASDGRSWQELSPADQEQVRAAIDKAISELPKDPDSAL